MSEMKEMVNAAVRAATIQDAVIAAMTEMQERQAAKAETVADKMQNAELTQRVMTGLSNAYESLDTKMSFMQFQALATLCVYKAVNENQEGVIESALMANREAEAGLAQEALRKLASELRTTELTDFQKARGYDSVTRVSQRYFTNHMFTPVAEPTGDVNVSNLGERATSFMEQVALAIQSLPESVCIRTLGNDGYNTMQYIGEAFAVRPELQKQVRAEISESGLNRIIEEGRSNWDAGYKE